MKDKDIKLYKYITDARACYRLFEKACKKIYDIDKSAYWELHSELTGKKIDTTERCE